MKAQSVKFGTNIITETISRVDLSKRPFKIWTEGTEEDDSKAVLADTLVIATGATAKRVCILTGIHGFKTAADFGAHVEFRCTLQERTFSGRQESLRAPYVTELCLFSGISVRNSCILTS